MMIPQPIPYQGSKRNIAKFILSYFPNQFDMLIEPFAGSAAISIAAAAKGKASKFYLNDINGPLMELLEIIVKDPDRISTNYTTLWREQLGKEKEFYFIIRDEFNRTHKPEYLLYLLARCVKASVRYNAKGEFNQSPDNRRKGRQPQNMRKDIFAVSRLLKDRTIFSSRDYRQILQEVSSNDLLYMDPPYQGVCSNRDPRYYTSVEFNDFLAQLMDLVEKDIPFILSYDGRQGNKFYGRKIPSDIGVHRIEINAGRSSQATLLGKNNVTYESIYLSNSLLKRLQISDKTLKAMTSQQSKAYTQLALPTIQ